MTLLKPIRLNRPRLYLVLAFITGAGVLVLDILSPLGVADGVLYVLPVLLGLLSGQRRIILGGAIGGTFLCLAGLFLSPDGGEMWKVLLNRFLAVFTIWMTTVLCLLQHRTQQRLIQSQGILERRVRDRTRELDEAHTHLLRETAYLQLSKDITAAANICPSVEEAARLFLERICKHTGWPVGHLYITEGSESKRLVSSKIWYLESPEDFEEFLKVTEATGFQPGIGLPGRVLQSGRPAWVTDATLDENFPRARGSGNIGIRAGFAFPVLIGNEVVGVMEFFSRQALEPQTAMLEVMAQAGVHLGRVMERRQAEAHREKLLEILKERIKELTCLFQVSKTLGTRKTLDEIFQEIQGALVQAWQYPEITRVRVHFDGRSYGDPNFTGSPWKLSAPLLVDGALRGSLEVYYTEERPQADEGPFLREERHLIDTLAHLLSVAAERKMAEEAMDRSQQQLRDLFHRLQKVREEERARIAREFHDQLGQVLTTMKIELTLLDKKLDRGQPGLRENTRHLLELVEGTLPVVKQLVMDLRPPVLDDLGLEEAIEWQARDFEKRTGIQCRVDLGSLSEDLDRDLATALFRIFQETLTNVARHAQATTVAVRLEEENGQLVFEITDNGKGIEACQVSDSKSLGLLGMKERLQPWGGVLDIHGTPQQGTRVTIRVQGNRV